MVRLETEVVYVGLVEDSNKWKVRSKKKRAIAMVLTLILKMKFMMLLLFAMGITLNLVLLKYQASVLGQGSKCIATITVFRTSSEIKSITVLVISFCKTLKSGSGVVCAVTCGVRVDCICTVSHGVGLLPLGVASICSLVSCLASFLASDSGVPSGFGVRPRKQVVILIGSSLSAAEISREIAGVAKEVHVAARSVTDETYEQRTGYDNMWFHSMIERVHDDGSVVFRNGRVVVADIILHCTGYKYHFPFLETNGIVTVDDNRVGPLYKHVFPPSLAPFLSFVGIPRKIFPFAMFELQSKWIAGVLSGRIDLPSKEEMMEDVEAFYLQLEASNVPKSYTHNMGDSGFELSNWLGALCGCEGFEEWRMRMFYASTILKRLRPYTYRDEGEDDDHLILEANQDFIKYTSKTI
ncbi:hypothetical protein GH714_029849 [Hevea brasiliensis]|uniref:Flavin-containing monooxygenase n=1 Tax=Hevea brasiliensis TaxID=3981 RepID=A0A6A6NK33_HEVBR|nr:hypothetical protein GH714_029849 [Hevea brasiliensis]